MRNIEKERLLSCKKGGKWKFWGPYLSERQWGTVREDYTANGSAWYGITHDLARSNAYRWGEEGIGGFSDDHQQICISWAFWNEKDPILKERFFGVTGPEGNHGEDVKELYYYLDSSPTHSYMKMLYKYPQTEYPYTKLSHVNKSRGKHEKELELIDTGIFDKDKYFDIYLEYAKSEEEDILFKGTIYNRSSDSATITVLPTIWFRNNWSPGFFKKPHHLHAKDKHCIKIEHQELGDYYLYFENNQDLLFCENETNAERLYGIKPEVKYYKDGINDYIVSGKKKAINPKKTGTKSSALYKLKIDGGSKVEVKFRLCKKEQKQPFSEFEPKFLQRKQETDTYYQELQKNVSDEDMRNVQRQAFAGLMWSKQFYYYYVKEWLEGDQGRFPPPEERKSGRNSKWWHLRNEHIISMPDKWEYPWYAAWDLAFHCVPIARMDPEFAKNQLLLFLEESYQHPNGQIPAYEWNFSDVNPPVHAWAVIRVFHIDKKMNGDKGDLVFLEKAFHKLLMNFTWWVNQKDKGGNNIFEGGFLGLDNIGVFDRSSPLPTGGTIEQADGTGWMAMYALNMLRISLDLAVENHVYEDMASKFMEHFLYIAGAMNNVRGDDISLWNEEDCFYYDVLQMSSGATSLKVRSIVGLIPLFAIETLRSENYNKLPIFKEKLDSFLKFRPRLAAMVSRWEVPGVGERRMFSLLRGYRMKKILKRMLDETEFLSDFGIRALSKYHHKHPYVFKYNGNKYVVKYRPGESDSGMFGGNSNWRGPIWFPINYLILESLLKFHKYYGDNFKVEYPTGSGKKLTIQEVVYKISERLMNIFRKDESGKRKFYDHPKFEDPHFKDNLLFYEYFHGDNGRGCGASHQTGWTGLIADIIHKYYN